MHRSALAFVVSALVLVLTGPVATVDAQKPKIPVPSSAMPPQPPPFPPAPSDVAAPPADAETTASGLATRVLKPGTGRDKPGATDLVTFNYAGWTSDGKGFDATARRGRAATLLMERLMRGMAEGLQMMVVGEQRRMWVPESLAFAGQQDRPQGMIVLDVELLAFEPSPRVPPLDVLAPPAEAERTASGLASRVLRPGTGNERPTRGSRVSVHYTGWTTDGEMFDSSVLRGEPATFGLDEVIRGWTEGVQLMVVGEKRRFWIPSRLAYNNEPNRPRGMLVFDIELLKINP